MKTKLLLNLQNELQPYLLFWDEWSLSPFCALSQTDIDIINIHKTNNFQLSLFGFFLHGSNSNYIPEIIQKLKSGFPDFKEFIVFNFLNALISMARKNHNGTELFLITPISHLGIPINIKDNLLSFKVPTLHQLGLFYKIEDLSDGWLFQNIQRFHIITEKQYLITNPVCSPVKLDSS